MKNTLKTAIIGCGDIAGGYDEKKTGDGVFTHAGAYRMFPEIKIAAAFDINQARLGEFCNFWNIDKPCSSIEELLDDSYDIISVCTSDNTHSEIIERILETGSAPYIWAEKPLTHSAESAEKVVRTAQERGVGLWLSNQRRWEPCHIEMRQRLRDHAIGNLIHANGYYVKGVTHIGCTMIDTLRFLCGEVRWVQAFPPFDRGSYGGDYSLRGLLGFDSGVTASITGCDDQEYVYSIFEIDVIGTHGRIRIEENGDLISYYQAKEYDHYPGFRELKLMERTETEMPWSMKYGLELLLKDFSEGKRSTYFAEDGLRDLSVVKALKKSAAHDGKRIELY